MRLFKKKVAEIVEELRPDKSFLVQTNDARFMFHLVKDKFYVRKVTSIDSRYGLVISLNGKKKYSERDLDLGVALEYVHPRLDKVVSGGTVRSIAVR